MIKKQPFEELASELNLEYRRKWLSSTPIKLTGRYRERDLNVYLEFRSRGRGSGVEYTIIEITHTGNIETVTRIIPEATEALKMAEFLSSSRILGKWAEFIVGGPAKVIGDVSSEYKAQWTKLKNIYKDMAVKRYPKGLKLIP